MIYREELAAIVPVNSSLAVSSTSVAEDTPDASMAGHYATTLNVKGPVALERAILDCWRSYLTVSAASNEDGMAVLIQPMLNAECAGVCFTVDPVLLRPDLFLVVSAWGLGAGIVGGQVPVDTAREFGLPVVCATLHATRNIPDGAWVTIDADQGLMSWK